MREQALIEVERKLQVASNTAMSSQQSALENVEKANKLCEEFEDAEERPKVAKVATNKARDDSKTAKRKHLSLKLIILLECGVGGMRLVG